MFKRLVEMGENLRRSNDKERLWFEVHRSQTASNAISMLERIFLNEGELHYYARKTWLDALKQDKEIDTLQYLNLLDALNHYNEEGHFRNSLIVQRALEQR